MWAYDSERRVRSLAYPLDGSSGIYSYGMDGRKLGTYQVSSGFTSIQPVSENLHFAGRLIKSNNKWVVTDRLGSVVKSETETLRYFPWGEERTVTAQNRDKFATYSRDSSGLDYALNRYYSPSHGRFLTPDPFSDSGRLHNLQSLNRYAYPYDPVNFYDPSGLQAVWVNEYPPRVGLWPTAGPLVPGGGPFSGSNGVAPLVDVPDDVAEEGDSASVRGASGVRYYGLTNDPRDPKFKVLKERLGDLRDRLNTDEDCLEWLRSGTNGGWVSDSLLATLPETSRVAHYIQDDGKAADGLAATARDVEGVNIIVNGRSWFYYNGTSQGPSVGDQLAILVHELAHITRPGGYIQNDGKNPAAQASNNAMVAQNCEKTIKGK